MELKIGLEDSKNPLLIYCFDSIAVYDKTTFLSYIFDKLRVSCWHEEVEDKNQRIDGMFDVLFGEVLKRRESNINPKPKT
jgi:hypothetical protein